MASAIVACALLAMGWCVRNGFVYDDWPAIVRNHRVTDPALWTSIWKSPYWLGTLWRPLTTSLFALQWRLGDGNAAVFHLLSLIAYSGCAVALWRLMLRLGATATAATTSALIFVVHPVHVEVVASAVGQAEIWVALAMMGAIAVYVDLRERGVTARRFALLLLLVAAGIAAKEQGFMIPLVLVAAECTLLAGRREPIAERVRMLIPVFALTTMLFVLRATILNSIAGETPAVALRGVGFTARVVTFLGVVPEYARLLLWPAQLQAEYGPPAIPVGFPFTTRHMLGVCVLIGCVILVVIAARRSRLAAFGLLSAGLLLAPVSNVITPTGLVMAERVLFLPTMALTVALAGAASAISVRRPAIRYAALGAVAVGVLLGALRSATRVEAWRDQDRFFTAMTADAPREYRAWKAAGEYQEQTAHRRDAVADMRRAIELWPHDPDVYERLGQLLRLDHQCGDAIPMFEAGLAIAGDASSMRAKLIECQIVERRWSDALNTASAGIAIGQLEFRSEIVRVNRFRSGASSVASTWP